MNPNTFMRQAFIGASLTFMGIHLGSYGLVTGQSEAELTDEIATTIGMSKESLQDFTKSPFLILDPTHKKTGLFFEFSMNAKPADEFVSGRGLNAQARQNPVYGYGGIFDRLSGGITGAIQPCIVLLDPNRITVENIMRMAAPDHTKETIHIPGNDADYLKIVALHELEHCRHVTTVREPLSQEYYSDRHALQKFLNDGGDVDVVRAWIGVRSAATLMNVLRRVGAQLDDPYTMAPALYDEFVLGTRTEPADLETLQLMQIAYDEVAFELLRRAQAPENGPTWNMRDPKFLLRLTKKVLDDPAVEVSSEARKLLELTKDSYEFLLRPQRKPPEIPIPIPPAPAVS